MKREGFGHAKFRLVARDLGIPVYAVYGIMESLWHTTALRFPRGDIGRLTNEEIAAEIDGLEIDGDRLVAVLIARRLLDQHPEHRIVVHDWSEHADDTVHYKLARAGVTFADGAISRRARPSATSDDAKQQSTTVGDSRRQSLPVGDGLPSPSPSPSERTDTSDSEPSDPSGVASVPSGPAAPVLELTPPTNGRAKARAKAAAIRGDPLEAEFETHVRPHYPRRDGDHRWRAALRGFQAARRGGEPLEAIVRGVRGYAAYCERRGLVGTEKVKMAATFFGSERSWREPWSQPQTGAATGPPRGTKEWVTCPTCDADYPRLIGEPDPHACPAQRAAQ